MKLCPFCGNEISCFEATPTGKDVFHCNECGAVVTVSLEKWNTRPIEEALRADNEIWREKSSKAIIEGIEKEGSLRGEIKRLRKALGNIKDKAELVESEASNATYGFAYEIEELAREALEGGEE